MAKVRDFNYGFLNSQKKPSPLKFGSKKLGNNGTQLHTIITHFPLIFRDYQSDLKDIWLNMISLLQCMQIVFSTTIRECDILRLEKATKTHLDGIVDKDIFFKNLLPKHHLLTHHPNTIREMGPPIRMWMKRYEAKHKQFTDMAKKTNNFINIAKSLAQKHQEKFCLNGFEVNSTILESKKVENAIEKKELNKYKQVLVNSNLSDCLVLNFVNINNNQYREGVVLIENSLACDIKFILKKDDNYFFVCELFDKIEFRECFNAIELKKSLNNDDVQVQVLELNKMSNKTSYQKHFVNGQVIVLCDTLDVHNKF